MDGCRRYSWLAFSEIDGAFVVEHVAIEADGRRWHRTKTQRARDRSRQSELEGAGWHFERVTFEDVHLNPTATIERIRTSLSARTVAATTVLRTSTTA